MAQGTSRLVARTWAVRDSGATDVVDVVLVPAELVPAGAGVLAPVPAEVVETTGALTAPPSDGLPEHATSTVVPAAITARTRRRGARWLGGIPHCAGNPGRVDPTGRVDRSAVSVDPCPW